MMMQITDISKVLSRPREGWGLTRPVIDVRSLEETVGAILEEVRRGGDKAVRQFGLLEALLIMRRIASDWAAYADARNRSKGDS